MQRISNQDEKDIATNEQNCEQFRSLNQIMYQIPVLAMTLTGGLWFGAGQLKDYEFITYWLFFLAGLSDIGFAAVLWRIRYVMQKYLDKIEEFNPTLFVNAKGDGVFTRSRTVVIAFQAMLLLSAGVSLYGWYSVMAGNNKKVEGEVPAIVFYNSEAVRLSTEYESAAFETVHAALIKHLPKPASKVLDVGAGTGRDAAALLRLGYDVTAVEPAEGMRKIALATHPELSGKIIDDRLPELGSLPKQKYDLILLSAVWMHIPPGDRKQAISRLTEITRKGGNVLISIRIGNADISRGMFTVDVAELANAMQQNGFALTVGIEQEDALKRPDVKWKTFVFTKYK